MWLLHGCGCNYTGDVGFSGGGSIGWLAWFQLDGIGTRLWGGWHNRRGSRHEALALDCLVWGLGWGSVLVTMVLAVAIMLVS